MLVLLALHMAAGLGAPALVSRAGPRACLALAAIPAAAAGWAAFNTGAVLAGRPPTETYTWVPYLGLDIALRLGPLSWLMVLVVGGVGALTLSYSARYFSAGEPGLGRFAGNFVGFAGAMLGLVVSDNLILLYVFWELTSVLSYLLIGHDPLRRANRVAAYQALIVTTAGGLAMLVGFVMLGERAGSYRWSQILAAPLTPDAYAQTALLLVLAGVVAKSALVPTTFWLPAAMVAPTPVSAYLHAAAMVKAGVYLVGLFAPVVAAVPSWRPVAYAVGGISLVAGGWAALRQTDLKRLLAYGTISQLGLLVMVLGAGTGEAALAGAAMLLAHALFKSALFLVAGIVEHQTGHRDLRNLSGLGRRSPALLAVAVLAAASMAGLPPLWGFVAKEAVLEAFRHDPVPFGAVAVGSALTVAYTLRFLWGAFAGKPGIPASQTHPAPVALLAPPAALALAGLVLGPLAGPMNRLLEPYADQAGGAAKALTLWPSPGPALWTSAAVLLAGAVLFGLRSRLAAPLRWLRTPVPGEDAYRHVVRVVERVAVGVTGVAQNGSLPAYLGVILLALVLVPGGALVVGHPWPVRVILASDSALIVVVAVLVITAILAAVARQRLTALVLVGVTGYSLALVFVLYGAPDLALTQLLVETVSVLVFVLVLRRMPANFSVRPARRTRWLRRGLGVLVGLVMAALALVTAAGRQAPAISDRFPELAVDQAEGRNVVNVTLVDIRAWDTLGELSVLVVAATGVASLIFQGVRSQAGPGRPSATVGAGRTGEGGPMGGGLRAAPILGARRRLIVFEMITRIIFHTIVVFAIFLTISGHNSTGGGFAGGMVAGLALTVRYLAGGRHELDEAMPVHAGRILGTGLLLAVGTGLGSLLMGRSVLESDALSLALPWLGKLHVVTSAVFDIGVFLVVLGLILDVLRSLGAEIDRQMENAAEGPA